MVLEHEEKKGSLRDQFDSLLLLKDQMLSHRWVPTSNTKIESFGDIMVAHCS
jgi:hypothetical protein